MKKLIYSSFVAFLSITSFAQNEEMHDAKIIGSFELGNKEVTTIFDEVSGCDLKTSPHSKNLFLPNDNVRIKVSEDKQMAEVIKSGLVEKVFLNKECNNLQQNCNSSLCIINNIDGNLQMKYSVGGFKVYYNAFKKNDVSIISNLIIVNINDGNKTITSSYSLDKSNVDHYKLFSHKGVKSEAQRLINNNTKVTGVEVSILEEFIENIKINEVQLKDIELAKNIYFHTAIIKTIKRSSDNLTNCNCTPVPFYFTDESPFLCQEDIKYDIDEILTTISNNYSDLKNNYDTTVINKVAAFLESKANFKSYITFEESYIAFGGLSINSFNDYLDNVEPAEAGWCPFGLGSGLGCCGNYSGCCWYWSYNCFLHDVACLHCDHWHCGPSCQSIN